MCVCVCIYVYVGVTRPTVRIPECDVPEFSDICAYFIDSMILVAKYMPTPYALNCIFAQFVSKPAARTLYTYALA